MSDECITLRRAPENPEVAIIGGNFSSITNYYDSPAFYVKYLPSYVIKNVCEQLYCGDAFTVHYFLIACASRIGQPLDYQELTQECDLSADMVRQWIAILEKNRILYLIKSYEIDEDDCPPASYLYFYDTGMAASLHDITSPEKLVAHELYEPLSQNLILNNLITTKDFSLNYSIKWFKEYPHGPIKFAVTASSKEKERAIFKDEYKKPAIFIDIRIALHYENYLASSEKLHKLANNYHLQPMEYSGFYCTVQKHEDTYLIHRGTTNLSSAIYLFHLSWRSAHVAIHPIEFYESEVNLQILCLAMLYLNKNSLHKICKYSGIAYDDASKRTLIELILRNLFSHNSEKLNFIIAMMNNAHNYEKYRKSITTLIEEIFLPCGQEYLFSDARRSLPMRIIHYYFPHIDVYNALHIANQILCSDCRTDRTCSDCMWRKDYYQATLDDYPCYPRFTYR